MTSEDDVRTWSESLACVSFDIDKEAVKRFDTFKVHVHCTVCLNKGPRTDFTFILSSLNEPRFVSSTRVPIGIRTELSISNATPHF